jgi:hypothetical protein
MTYFSFSIDTAHDSEQPVPVDLDRVYIGNRGNDRVQVFDEQGTFLPLAQTSPS